MRLRAAFSYCFRLLLCQTIAPLAAEEAWRYVLIDAEKSVNAETFELSRQDLPETGETPWSVSMRTLHGGKQEGVQLITLDNGTMTIVVVPTRGMSLYEVKCGDVRLGWDSPVKEHVHPQYIHLDARGGLGWLDGFNEWMVRCGLEFAGHPGTDEFITNTGDTGTMDLTLHGKIGNIPASRVELLIDKAPPHRIRLRGVVHERLFFGPKLELTAELSTVPGSAELRLHDAVTNRGGGDQEFQLIYHTNFGTGLLEEGAGLVVPAREVAPMNAHAAKSILGWTHYAAPTPGFIEEVYLVHPFADERNRTGTLLKNRGGSRGVTLNWSVEELPYLTIWKNTTSEADGYVTGLEPATGFPYNRKVERAAGRLPVLKAGATREFTLDFSVHRTADEVARSERALQALQGSRDTLFRDEPEPPQPVE